MRSGNRTETLFDSGKPEQTHHHWTAGDRHAMENTRDHINEIQKTLRQKDNWQLWAGNLIKYDIPALEELLNIEGLTSAQKEEVQNLITAADEAVPELFESPEQRIES